MIVITWCGERKSIVTYLSHMLLGYRSMASINFGGNIEYNVCCKMVCCGEPYLGCSAHSICHCFLYITTAESGSTPKRQRQKSGSQAPHTSSKSPASNVVKGKKKKVKKKDIYASSSEEVIPPPIKRGFQYTDVSAILFQ